MNTELEIFSTFAKDVFVTKTGQILRETSGGPATFIQRALDDLGVEYTLTSGNTAIVEILLTENGEFGEIKTPLTKKMIKPRQADCVLLVSTLLDEWTLPLKKSRIFLDIQGYARCGKAFGDSKQFKIDPLLESNIICVKAEREESKYISTDFLTRQKNKQLVVTKGREGLELYILGKKYDIPATLIMDLPDTVGAGDTWFSAYVAYQLKGFECLEAAKMATIFVAKFLKSKIERKYENKK